MIFIAALIGYIFGSIPFGLILTKVSGLGDIRSIGSGNIGATNVLRTGKKTLAILTLLLDMIKGVCAVLFVHFLARDFWLMENGAHCASTDCIIPFFDYPSLPAFLAGFFALLGHMFPIWIKFKGGKGVATGIGVLFALSLPVGLMVAVTWLVTALLFRISSLSALVAVFLSPVYAWVLTANYDLSIFCAMMAFLIISKHHANIKRLIKGEESKITFKKQREPS